MIQPYIRLLQQQFGNDSMRVLDLGCGNGLNLAMFAEEGFDVTGIDVSSKMLEVARDSCPSAALIFDDILSSPIPSDSFHGVFAKAIIHLFPRHDAMALLKKLHHILKPGGVFYVTTTVESSSREGLLEKEDYKGKVCRYRRSWFPDELKKAVTAAGFRVVKSSFNVEDNRKKTWVNLWCLNEAKTKMKYVETK